MFNELNLSTSKKEDHFTVGNVGFHGVADAK